MLQGIPYVSTKNGLRIYEDEAKLMVVDKTERRIQCIKKKQWYDNNISERVLIL